MIKAIEAVCINGTIRLLDPVVFEEAEPLVILRFPKGIFLLAPQRIRGAMKGMLSSVDELIVTQ
ncbi:MAG: hypothetical protein H7829_09180 [Magnetococcus sp. THC-1_WYH]